MSNKQKTTLTSLEPGLQASVREGMFQSAMVGCGETYISAFAIFLQASTVQIGFLSSLPAAVSGVLQVLSLRVANFITSRRALLEFAATLQSWCWVVMCLVALVAVPGTRYVWLVIFSILAYYIAAGIYTPTWNSLIGDAVPQSGRGRFFGFRSQRCGICAFVALSVSGQFLDLSERLGLISTGFAFIFLCAAWFRFRSLYWLRRYEDPILLHDPEQQFSLLKFLLRIPKSNFGRFALFIACINFAVAFSGPYFSLYLLRDLQLSYASFTLVTATATLTQFLIMQHWGKLTDTFGSKQILTACGVGIAINPALWLFSQNLLYLVCIQIFSGLFWAGFNLAASTFLFDAVSPPKRARCAAYQAFISGCLQFCGSMMGAYVASHLPASVRILNLSWTPVSPLLLIFLISGALRAATVVIFLPKVKEVREVSHNLREAVRFRILHLRPLSGIVFGVSAQPTREPDADSDD